MRNVVTQAQFARGLRNNGQGCWIYSPGSEGKGVARSTVTRWLQKDYIDITPNKKVRIAESLAKINANQGARTDLKEKHAQNRGQAIKAPESGQNLPAGEEFQDEEELRDMSLNPDDMNKSKADIVAEKMHFKNLLYYLDVDIESGSVLVKSEFVFEISDLGKAIGDGLDRIVDNQSPQLVAKPYKSNRLSMIQKALNGLQEEL